MSISPGLSALFVLAVTWCCMPCARSHDGPDPRCRWVMDQRFFKDGWLQSQLGPKLRCQATPVFERVGQANCFRLLGEDAVLVADGTWADIKAQLPKSTLTVAAWVSLDETVSDGGIVGAFQDNGDAETGWLLGYNQQHFSFAVSSRGADDGDGKLTYLVGKSLIEPGKWYHVCGVYDGSEMQLWVNGVLEGKSPVQSGDILYPADAKLVVGGYVDANESFPLRGRIAQVSIYDLAAKEGWIGHDFEHQKAWSELPPALDASKSFEFLVKPYLQFATVDSIRVMCELNRNANVKVRYGETTRFTHEVAATSDDGRLHTAVLRDLRPETGYYYQLIVNEEGADQPIQTDPCSFQTASLPETPFAFAVMGDTQGNPQVNGTLAKYIWALRPNFLVIPGDLVDDGKIKGQWVQEFFASMSPLFERVVFYPVLGNHEKNADHYYRYMDLPQPEYYYTFRYGNAQFFMLDSNKRLDPDSEQYLWLQSELEKLKALESRGESEITWKFVSFHHPVYSSDEDDYGNLWKGKSTWGDMRLREVSTLFDRFGVDVVWSGHIHSYERTWPILRGKVTQDRGVVYMITGGGGGGLEQAGPIRPPFQNHVRRGHHFVYVAIHGKVLELKSYDLEGRLFDVAVLDKRHLPARILSPEELKTGEVK
ncbi:MAG: LamG-like jellyroll fold domain-containing protein [Pirellula sp.]